jgi:hypothetical protein
MKCLCRVKCAHIVSLKRLVRPLSVSLPFWFLSAAPRLRPQTHIISFFYISFSNSTTIVDPDEIKRLGKRFRKLDLDNSGSLSIDEFMSLPELQQNPLVQRVIDIFDADGNGEVDFKGMLLRYEC